MIDPWKYGAYCQRLPDGLMRQTLLILTTGLLVAACATPSGVGTQTASSTVIASDPGSCRAVLGAEPSAASMRFDGTRMQLLNWNTQKNVAPEMMADLSKFGGDADLILLQEAVRNSSYAC